MRSGERIHVCNDVPGGCGWRPIRIKRHGASRAPSQGCCMVPIKQSILVRTPSKPPPNPGSLPLLQTPPPFPLNPPSPPISHQLLHPVAEVVLQALKSDVLVGHAPQLPEGAHPHSPGPAAVPRVWQAPAEEGLAGGEVQEPLARRQGVGHAACGQ